MSKGFTSEWLEHHTGIVAPDAPAQYLHPRRGQGRKLNKTETAGLEMLRIIFPKGLILIQAVRLDFKDGTSYHPDFVVIDFLKVDDIYEMVQKPIVVEIKGSHIGKVAWSRHGVERFRRARDVFSRWFTFQLWEHNKGQWRIDHDSSSATPQATTHPTTVACDPGGPSAGNQGGSPNP